jgi:catechol 1,2-dioxygenase
MTPMQLFTTEGSVDLVNARMGPDTDPRLREIMEIFVAHIHAAVKESRLTSAEWARGIEFLTSVGQSCNEWRQEFMLLSDVLGVSMLVDGINNDRPHGATENTVLGPFHVAGVPEYDNGADIRLDGKGEPAVVHGQVIDVDGKPIAGAMIDVWQANHDGFYDVQQPGALPKGNLRGIFTTDANGEYWFRTAKPRYYPIPDDGPVGQMLEALGRGPNRAAHLHFIVKAPGFDTVVTHIFPDDCPYLPIDAVFGVKQSLVTTFQRVEAAEAPGRWGVEAPFWLVAWDFTLCRTTPPA